MTSKLRGTFDIREDWVKELRDVGAVVVNYVRTNNNCADLLTKVHRTARYKQLLGMLGHKQARKISVDLAMSARVRLIAG